MQTERTGSFLERETSRVRLFRTQGGAYIWAWDKYEPCQAEPTFEDLRRADALVLPPDDFRGWTRDATGLHWFRGSSDETDREYIAHKVWIERPTVNAKITEASTLAWIDAARRDLVIAEALAEEIN